MSSRKVDATTLSEPRRVRIFRGHTGRITDMCLTPDDRWLITSSTDSTVRVWDIPTARCLDWFSFEDAVTSMTMSPTGEFLATTHVENNGIYVWANRTHFGNVLLSDDVGEVPRKVVLPTPKVNVRDDRVAILEEEAAVEEARLRRAEEELRLQKETEALLPTRPLAPGLTTMSGLAKSKWETLPQLDVIKQRNKPKEPPKAPEKAPFFLGQLEGVNADGSGPSLFEHSKVAQKVGFLQGEGVDGQDNGESGGGAGTRLLRLGRFGAEMSLVGLLEKTNRKQMSVTEELASLVIDYLMGLSASGVDVQLSSLSMGAEDLPGRKHLESMLKVLELAVQSSDNYDAIQAYLHRFCYVHGDTIAVCPELLDAANRVRAAQDKAWGKVQRLLQETSCLVKLFTKAH